MKIQACLEVFSYHDNLSIPLTLDVLSDIRQIEEIIQETEDYCIHDTNSTRPDQLVFFILMKPLSTLILRRKFFLTDGSPETASYVTQLQFIECQLDNILKHKFRRRYNALTQVMALKSHLISPACYRYLQSLECLSIPHPKTLLKFWARK